MPRNKMSSGRTIVSAVASDRVITKFTQAFHPDATPYQKVNFHPKVKAACAENKTGRVGLKIAKAVLVGDVSVGKTCLVNRFCHDVFDREYKATIGVDFEVEKFSVLGVHITLQVWDTAGQERFKCIAASYYRGAQIVIVVFDMTDEESLHHTVKWMEDACATADEPVKFLVGTKKDLLSPAAYSDIETRALKYASQMEAEFWATSSKNGENVQDFFFRAVCMSFDTSLQKELEAGFAPSKKIGNDLIQVQRSSSDLYERKKKSSKCCN
ncbi:ras-related protein Rab-34 [Aplysia californica]|uniref:Ras-related protein Rab-34 n=1 Tax=Aplysia californica TaxID=6500 RepID=A0ABM0K0X9_APLCA|nr:ras-related protein Rab-34 [Aplysia californica]